MIKINTFYHSLFAFLIIFCGMSYGANSATLSPQARLMLNDYNSAFVTHAHKATTNDVIEKYGLRNLNGQLNVGAVLWVEDNFDRSVLHTYNAEVRTVLYDLITIWIPVENLTILAENAEGIRFVQAGKGYAPFLDGAVLDSRVDKVHEGADLGMPYTGEGVIIGVTDNGFDLKSPVFLNRKDSTTRLISLWNQREDDYGTPPPGYTYGMELSSPEEFEKVRFDSSNSSHGTHVAGIAAGWGWGTPYNGIAYDSELIFVRHQTDVGARIDAFRYIKDIAQSQGKPAVINTSWGNYQGPQDGTSLLSRGINHLNSPGLIFVSSAGNTGNVNFHVDHTFSDPGDTLKTVMDFDNPDNHNRYWGQSATIWGDVEQTFTLTILLKDNSGSIVDTLSQLSSSSFSLNETISYDTAEVELNIAGIALSPLNNKSHMMVRIRKDNLDDHYIALHVTASEGTLHMWNLVERSNNYTNRATPFISPFPGYKSGTSSFGIGEPACTEKVITVGAHRVNKLNGSVNSLGLASFSSRGPTPDGRILPDLTAKGQHVASALNPYDDDERTIEATLHFMNDSVEFSRLSGTSMSSPVVSGIIALMLQVHPELDFEMTRNILTQTAFQDRFTGNIPPEGSNNWGHGKADAWQALRLTEAVAGVTSVESKIQPNNSRLYPNPASGSAFIELENENLVDMQMVDLTGKRYNLAVVETRPGLYKLELNETPPGMYLVVVEGQSDNHYFRLIITEK